MGESTVLFTLLLVEAAIAFFVFLLARARAQICKRSLQTARRRLYLGSVVTALAAILMEIRHVNGRQIKLAQQLIPSRAMGIPPFTNRQITAQAHEVLVREFSAFIEKSIRARLSVLSSVIWYCSIAINAHVVSTRASQQ